MDVRLAEGLDGHFRIASGSAGIDIGPGVVAAPRGTFLQPFLNKIAPRIVQGGRGAGVVAVRTGAFQLLAVGHPSVLERFFIDLRGTFITLFGVDINHGGIGTVIHLGLKLLATGILPSGALTFPQQITRLLERLFAGRLAAGCAGGTFRFFIRILLSLFALLDGLTRLLLRLGIQLFVICLGLFFCLLVTLCLGLVFFVSRLIRLVLRFVGLLL